MTDSRTDREILEEINRLVQDLALKGAKTIAAGFQLAQGFGKGARLGIGLSSSAVHVVITHDAIEVTTRHERRFA